MTDRPTAPTDRPALRPAAPERASVNGHRPTLNRSTASKPADRTPGRLARLVARIHTRPADQKTPVAPAAVDTPSRPAPPSSPATDPTVVARAAAIHRRPTQRPADRPAADTDIAPVPRRLKWLGVWLDRTLGTMPLLAPLLVSGYFTMQVFTDQPIGAHAAVAFFATLALEGGVWKLSRLYEKTLVAGDSTIALRAGITLYLTLISGLIYWHADHQAQARGQEDLGYDALPAFGVAVMSALGVFIWSRTARWARRRELHALGRVDTQAPKFAALAWILTPIETPQALRHAVKYRIPSPVDAVEDLRLYKASGKPSVWPPLPKPTDVGAPATDRPTVERTRPAATDAPTAATAPARATAATPTPRPAATPTERPTVTASTASAVPTGNPQATDRPTFSPAAVENAALIRQRYGTTASLRLATVRGDFGWSYDKANPAFKAYLAGADHDPNPAR